MPGPGGTQSIETCEQVRFVTTMKSNFKIFDFRELSSAMLSCRIKCPHCEVAIKTAYSHILRAIRKWTMRKVVMYVFMEYFLLSNHIIYHQFNIYSPSDDGPSEEIQCLCDFDTCNVNSDPDPNYIAGAHQV